MGKTTRRNFFKTAALGVAATTFATKEARPLTRTLRGEEKDGPQFSLGLASYTFREFSLEDAMAMTKRVGLEKIALKSMHLPLESSEVEISAASKEGQTVEMGRGAIDIPRFIRTLIKINYKGTVAFEYEKDGKDPLPVLAESVGYLQGILAVI